MIKDGCNLSAGNSVLLLSGAIAGVAWQLNAMAKQMSETIALSTMLTSIAAGLVIGPMLFWLMSSLSNRVARSIWKDAEVAERFTRLSRYSYLIFCVFVLGAIGLVFSKTYIALIVMVWLFVQILIGIHVNEWRQNQELPGSLRWVTFLFLLSGFSALIYQMVWQRLLFTSLGVNIESITLIVSIFMFGLGVGSVVGGRLSSRYSQHLPIMFVVCELLIGLFGFFSIPLIQYVSALAVNESAHTIAVVVYALLMVPTLLMGATLPLLVTYLHNHYSHIGQSVGNLYWINTIGSAVACFVTVDFLFRVGGLQSSIWVAASLNVIVGVLVYRYTRTPSAAVVGEKF